MDADEKAVCDFLKSWPGQFVGAREISRRAAGKWRFRDDPEWAIPVLARLVEDRIVESDSTGHYRLAPQRKRQRPKRWVAPNIQRILEESKKDFSDILDQEDQADSDKDK